MFLFVMCFSCLMRPVLIGFLCHVLFLLVSCVQAFLVSRYLFLNFLSNNPHVFIVGLLCFDVVNRCQ